MHSEKQGAEKAAKIRHSPLHAIHIVLVLGREVTDAMFNVLLQGLVWNRTGDIAFQI